ncbi:protein timeless homolog isoform X1 [Salvia splendens]|uniref:protein timeless homolog isoform X1 n=1 Tax=Salvia splendens TaxID=180675 RepID=UPI001C25F2D3|nr:protein timeless homolog isoform X1 [Salvia splendens]
MDGLSTICAGLGIVEEDDNGKRIGYNKGEYCLDNLKDLLRFLRRDDPEKRDVFKQICKWNTVGKDLIPIIEYFHEDRNLVLNAVKVLVFLTMPIEPTSVDISQQIEYLWGLKSSITFSNIVPVIVSLLENPLENLESESFTEDDWKLVQLVLTLFRNVLAIQDISTQQNAEGSATRFLFIRDKFLELLFQENVMDLILVLSQHTGGSQGYLRQDNLLLLETYYHIFKGQNPELIAKAYLKSYEVEDDSENLVSSLQSFMTEEQEKRRLTRFHNLSCYSKFTGTYTRVTLDGSKALLKGNPSPSDDALLKGPKVIRGPSKREKWEHRELPSTKNKTLQLLDGFISQFLMGGYNVLMQSIREDIDKEHLEIQSTDVIMFFKVAEFVTSFQYHKCVASKPSIDANNEETANSLDDDALFKGSICGPIAETLTESMFLLVISKWRYAFEALKQTNDYKFLSAAGSLAKVMIRMLDLVLKKSLEDSKEPQTARILLYKLFYDQTEEGMTRFLLNLIKSFDTHKQSKSDLANLVETVHVVLRLLENLQARGTLRVSKKLRKRKKKAETKNENVCEPSVGDVSIQNEIGSSTCEEPNDVNMLEKETLTNDEFNTEADESIRDAIKVGETNPANLGCNNAEVDDRNITENDGLHTDDSSDEQPILADEVDFKVSTLVSALASNTIIQKLCWLLKFYKTNSIMTNHYIVTVLRRICDDLELSPMLYQLSLLTIFFDILEEQKSRPHKEYENIVDFLTSLTRRMLRKMKNYPLLLVEVLFVKTRKESHYINCGSMLNELNSIKNESGEGRNGTKKSGSGFFDDQKWVRRNLADALGDDDYDNQEEDDPFKENFQKFRQNPVEEMIEEIAISDRESSEEESGKLSSRRGNGLILTDEITGKLKDLYEKYKDNPECSTLIAGELDPDGDISKPQISKFLRQLGLKLPAKEKKQSSKTSNQLQGNKKDASKDTTHPNLTPTEKSSSPKRPLNSRKRVDAFSVSQEQEIKDLFEQFKDHKRCSYMIANALDSSGSISTSQVSRKLKQLGLVRPKKKPPASMHLRDEIVRKFPSEGAGNSDSETLSSLKIRGKHNRNGKHTDKSKIKKVARESPGDISDDELLSSVLAKTKKKPRISDDDDIVLDYAFGENLSDTNLVGRDTQISESIRADIVQSKQTGSKEIDVSVAKDSHDLATETIGEGTYEEALGDELADFDEDTQPVSITQESSASRRQRRMVIDFEDDEE